MISAVCWIPKGARRPFRCSPSRRQRRKLRSGDIDEEGNEGMDVGDVPEEVGEAAHALCAAKALNQTQARKARGVQAVADGLEELNMDAYDDEDEGTFSKKKLKTCHDEASKGSSPSGSEEEGVHCSGSASGEGTDDDDDGEDSPSSEEETSTPPAGACPEEENKGKGVVPSPEGSQMEGGRSLGRAEPPIAFDWDTHTLSLRINKGYNFIEERSLNMTPSNVVTCMMSPTDEQTLKKYHRTDLRHLQAYHAFASSVVSHYQQKCSESYRERYKGYKAKYMKILTENEKLNTRNVSLEKELDALKASLALEKGQMTSTNEGIRKELEELRSKQADMEALHIEEKSNLADGAATLEAERSSLDCQVKDLFHRLTVAEAVPKAPEVTLEAAAQVYKESPDFQRDMMEYGEDAFQLLKDALVKDGQISRDVTDGYSYFDCLERGMNGEFD